MQVRRGAVERALSTIPAFESPRANLEQVPTPADIATDLLFAAFSKGDIGGRLVFDLGCGTGVLGIGAALLGAMPVWGFDVDGRAVAQARQAAVRLGASQVEWEVCDITDVVEHADVVLCNPPFGASKAHADRPFLEAASRCGRVAYTFHNGPSQQWARHHIETALGGAVTDAWSYPHPIRAVHPHHTDPIREVPVVVFRWTTGT